MIKEKSKKIDKTPQKKVGVDLVVVEDEGLLTLEEVAKRLDKSVEFVRQITEGKTQNQTVKAGRGTSTRKVIKLQDVLALQQQQQNQLECQRNIEKSDKIVDKFTDEQIKLAFGQTLEDKSGQEIANLSLQMIAMSIKKIEESERRALQNELNARLEEQFTKYGLSIKRTRFNKVVDFKEAFLKLNDGNITLQNYKDLLKQFYQDNKK